VKQIYSYVQLCFIAWQLLEAPRTSKNAGTYIPKIVLPPILLFRCNLWARGSVVLRHYAIKIAGSRPDEVNFSIYLILPAALGLGVHSASNRNEFQKQKNSVSGE
jgi:hypothetical protein